MTSLTDEGARQALKIHGDASWIILLTIEHPDKPTKRFTSNPKNVVSRGQTFIYWPFILELMNNTDGVPTGKLRIANISRYIWGEIESLTTSPTFTFEIVLSTDPDTVIDYYPLSEFWSVKAGNGAIEADLTHERYATENWPGPRMTPKYFPWLSR